MAVSDSLKPRCRAHNRQGGQCALLSVPGGRVCRMHGGMAPQVQAAAGERIKALAPRAVDVIEELLNDYESAGLRFAAARDILDRAGYSAKQRIEHSGEAQSGDRLTPEERAAIAKTLLGG
jgi:hypothetical protein